MSDALSTNTYPWTPGKPLARKLVAFLVVTLAAVTLPATAAFANWELCGATGYHCVYKNEYGADGGVRAFPLNDKFWNTDTFERCYFNCNVNDSVSSMWNRESYTVRNHIHSDYASAAIDIVANRKSDTICCGFNNALSAHRGL